MMARALRIVAAALLPLLLAHPAAAQSEADPRGAAAREQLDRCDGGAPAAEGATRKLRLSFTDLLPFAREILRHRDIDFTAEAEGRRLRIALQLEDLRDLPAPEGNPRTIYLPGEDASAVMLDRRSRIRPLWRVDESTVRAADIAYDIRQSRDGRPSPPWLDHPGLEGDLPGYSLLALYADPYSGFAAAALEAGPETGLAPHRIYAVAGTHVFEHRDFRSWASGLTFGRAQFTSNAALRMLRDAARYAHDLDGGGEVFITGQSQGGLTAQGLGYLLQAYLDARDQPHHLAHVVSWGGVGAQEVILRMLAEQERGAGRGYGTDLERHWAATEPDYPTAAEVWRVLEGHWNTLPHGGAAAHLRETMRRMRILGYFFEIDLFARAGTFPGTTLAFPTALILPRDCDLTVVEALVGVGAGRFGVRLESHFLKGYRRAVERGAIALARPALPAKWDWVTETLPAFERLGYLWLQTLYLEGPAMTPENWRACTAAPRWLTPANRFCRADYWPGCAPEPEELRWCLVRDAPPGTVTPIGR